MAKYWKDMKLRLVFLVFPVCVGVRVCVCVYVCVPELRPRTRRLPEEGETGRDAATF